MYLPRTLHPQGLRTYGFTIHTMDQTTRQHVEEKEDVRWKNTKLYDMLTNVENDMKKRGNNNNNGHHNTRGNWNNTLSPRYKRSFSTPNGPLSPLPDDVSHRGSITSRLASPTASYTHKLEATQHAKQQERLSLLYKISSKPMIKGRQKRDSVNSNASRETGEDMYQEAGET